MARRAKFTRLSKAAPTDILLYKIGWESAAERAARKAHNKRARKLLRKAGKR